MYLYIYTRIYAACSSCGSRVLKLALSQRGSLTRTHQRSDRAKKLIQPRLNSSELTFTAIKSAPHPIGNQWTIPFEISDYAFNWCPKNPSQTNYLILCYLAVPSRLKQSAISRFCKASCIRIPIKTDPVLLSSQHVNSEHLTFHSNVNQSKWNPHDDYQSYDVIIIAACQQWHSKQCHIHRKLAQYQLGLKLQYVAL